MAEYTAWYRVGTVALTKNSKIVTGTGTFWLAAGLHTGDIFSVDCVTEYEVASIDSNTQITLRTAYTGDSTTESAYRIIRNFTASMAAQTAADTASLLNDFRRYVDADMQSIHGKSAYQTACEKGYTGTESEWVASLKGPSAYEVAVANGYNGTVSEWLESLKANNEWATLDARTSGLTADTTHGLHNCLYRNRNLGEFTQDHLTAIRHRKFQDIWVGDYFTHTVTRKVNGEDKTFEVKDRIAQFYVNWQNDNLSNNVLLIRCNILTNCDDYRATFNRRPSGTEGEDDYDPGTIGNLYPTSNWYTVVRPKFIEEIESIYGANNCRLFNLSVPSAMNLTTPTAWVNLYSKAHLPSVTMFGLPFFSLSDGAFPYNWGGHGLAYKTLPLYNHTQQWTADALGNGHNWTVPFACAEAVKRSNGELSVAGLCMGGLKMCAEWKYGFDVDGVFGGCLCPIFCIG